MAGVTGVSGKSSSCALRLVGDTDSGRDEDNGIDDEGDDDGLVAAFSLTVVVVALVVVAEAFPKRPNRDCLFEEGVIR